MINVLIPDAEAPRIRRVVHCLSKEPDCQVYLLSAHKKSHMRFSRFCKSFFYTNDIDFAFARRDKTIEIIENKGIDILLPISVEGYNFIYRNYNLFSEITKIILTPEKRIYQKVEDKNQFARFCQSNEIKIPRTLFFNGLDVLEDLRQLNPPVLLKPIRSEGGVGIRLFSEIELCCRFLEKNMTIIKNKYILQEFIDVAVFCVNVLCYKGKILAHTMQKGILPGNEKFRFSEGIQFINDPFMYQCVENLVRRLEWSGVANIDLLYNTKRKEIFILEVNPRLWGTVIGSLKAGINFPYLLVQKSLEENFEPIDEGFHEVRYAHLDKNLLKNILRRKSPFKFSETNLDLLIKDPLPTIMAKF